MIDDRSSAELEELLGRIGGCRLCAFELPHEPRPVVQAGRKARVLIVGQAPGRRVHETGIPWNDASGARLREWMDVGPQTFYDPDSIALVPMGFCYPGVSPKGGGDRPPMPQCAPKWHSELIGSLPDIRLTLLVGRYAQARYLGDKKQTMTEAVAAFAEHGGDVLPLPHPSWRVVRWIRDNPWFEETLLPVLRQRVAEALEP